MDSDASDDFIEDDFEDDFSTSADYADVIDNTFENSDENLLATVFFEKKNITTNDIKILVDCWELLLTVISNLSHPNQNDLVDIIKKCMDPVFISGAEAHRWNQMRISLDAKPKQSIALEKQQILLLHDETCLDFLKDTQTKTPPVFLQKRQ